MPWLPLASTLLDLSSKETSAQGWQTHMILCHRAILNGIVRLCHFYEVSAWHRSLKRKPTQSYFCNWRWARMGIVKWDYYLRNEQWKLNLFLPITEFINSQLSMVMTISIWDHPMSQCRVGVSVWLSNGLQTGAFPSVPASGLTSAINLPSARIHSFQPIFLATNTLNASRILPNRGWDKEGKPHGSQSPSFHRFGSSFQLAGSTGSNSNSIQLPMVLLSDSSSPGLKIVRTNNSWPKNKKPWFPMPEKWGHLSSIFSKSWLPGKLHMAPIILQSMNTLKD